MDVRSLVLIATLATSAALAGCIEAPGFLSADNEKTAFGSKEAADAAALAWNPDAKLVSVMTIELTNSTDSRVPLDPEVGNGRALAWWYVYCVEGDAMQTKAFRVMDGQAVEESDADAIGAAGDFDSMDMGPITDWEIDSDAAIEVAKTDEGFRLAAQGFNATVIQGVASHSGMSGDYSYAEDAPRGDGGEEGYAEMSAESATVWWIVAGSVDGIVIALVDATHGTLLEVRDLDFSFAMPKFDFASAGPGQFVPEPVHLEGADEVRDGEPMEYPFSVSFPMSGDMDFTVEGDDALRGARWTIVDQEGDSVARSPRGFFPGMDQESEWIDLEEPGDYTLVIETSSRTMFIPVPGQAISYEFVLHLEPMMDDHEHDDER